LRVRRDIEFGWMVGLFATFILACGATHLFRIYVLWVPAYGVEAVIKIITAAASIGTALLLLPLFPKLAALPSPSQLRAVNQQLVEEGRERERTAEMLRQSQKLEAIGRLTGGVAHDFNNLLHVVIGNLERAQRLAGSADPALGRALAQATTGAERAAELTDQLLTFARRQPLQRSELALSATVRNISPLIERALGSDIEYAFEPGDAEVEILADRNQLENALLNLAINARDAMPQGGSLQISIMAAEDPSRVELRIEDTGAGMDAATLERATEPFFTTKPIGEGTGLGLSQVYGMTEQIGGSMAIESAPGTGTRVRLFLPRAIAQPVSGGEGA
jgi:signal transduction histidine kinase